MSKLSIVNCPQCGAPITQDRCEYCRSTFKKEQNVESITLSGSTKMNSSYTNTYQEKENSSAKKSIVVFILLTVFLSPVGIQYLYLRQYRDFAWYILAFLITPIPVIGPLAIVGLMVLSYIRIFNGYFYESTKDL